MKKIPKAKLALSIETIRLLTDDSLTVVVGGGRNPKPNPSGQVSCASAKCNTH